MRLEHDKLAQSARQHATGFGRFYFFTFCHMQAVTAYFANEYDAAFCQSCI
jgi:hypothetical protein